MTAERPGRAGPHARTRTRPRSSGSCTPARTIAVVGLSKNELRASHFVGYYLQRHGYRMIPVNPRETEILGQPSYPSLARPATRPASPSTSSTCSGRPTRCRPSSTRRIAVGASALWCQFGVINVDAARTATDAGMTVIMDRCIKVEHARYVGRMHWLGFNTTAHHLGARRDPVAAPSPGRSGQECLRDRPEPLGVRRVERVRRHAVPAVARGPRREELGLVAVLEVAPGDAVEQR